jgi:ABC-type Mn2+/Zn2+ transport system ATPase subunit
LLLENVGFAVPRQRAIGLTGESGAGKSTLLKAIMGILDRAFGLCRAESRWTAGRLKTSRRACAAPAAEQCWASSRKTP